MDTSDNCDARAVSNSVKRRRPNSPEHSRGEKIPTCLSCWPLWGWCPEMVESHKPSSMWLTESAMLILNQESLLGTPLGGRGFSEVQQKLGPYQLAPPTLLAQRGL